MRIGALIDVGLPLDELVGQVRAYADGGLASAWAVQIFGYDALTLLGVVGHAGAAASSSAPAWSPCTAGTRRSWPSRR